jgi:hypothetical protein
LLDEYKLYKNTFSGINPPTWPRGFLHAMRKKETLWEEGTECPRDERDDGIMQFIRMGTVAQVDPFFPSNGRPWESVAFTALTDS